MTAMRLDGAETYYAPSRAGTDTSRDGHLITIHNGTASCSCPARNGTCWAVKELMATQTSPIARLQAIGVDFKICRGREDAAVVAARSAGLSWHRIAVALGRTTEGVRRKHRGTTP